MPGLASAEVADSEGSQRQCLSQRTHHMDEHVFNNHTQLLRVLGLLLVNCVTWGDLLNISGSQFSLLRPQRIAFALQDAVRVK